MSITLDAVQPLTRIEAWVARNHPDRLPIFRPAAAAATVERIESKLGRLLPPDVRALYAAHDGQPEGAPALYLNQRWLPLDLVAVAWEDLCLRYDNSDALRLVANGNGRSALKAVAWSSDWLPLFGAPRGDHYCIDLRLERPERYGQIIWFLYDRPERTVVAPSLSHFLSRVATGLDAGGWHLDAGYDGLSD
ncbi:MAG TPA: SMI1/KNR4 family protein [Bosea sp. (in: a-proteobacteria)]|jgi:cell wall assembly regulator SMI1|uniref:SMI1/KNR4 family protein n=1 Tax=Bosea sp. (in: a-proteobacteria) TaxID=1871050 RepID=UPI002E104D7C|nr:SMI1/KNR4 family protein [Bosea sp. (in: a-proteobacteria)]